MKRIITPEIIVIADLDGTYLHSELFWITINEKIYYMDNPNKPPLSDYNYFKVLETLGISKKEMFDRALSITNESIIKEALETGLLRLFPDSEEAVEKLAQHGCKLYLSSDGPQNYGELYVKHFPKMFSNFTKELFDAEKPKKEKTVAMLSDEEQAMLLDNKLEGRLFVKGDTSYDEGLSKNIGAIYVPVTSEHGSRLQATDYILNHKL